MKDVNKMILVGRLGGDPVKVATTTGKDLVHFSVATSYRKKEAADQPITQWHRVVVWGNEAQAASQYLRKGNPVFVEGYLRSRNYRGKDGQNRTTFEVHAESVSFLGGATVHRVAEEAIQQS